MQMFSPDLWVSAQVDSSSAQPEQGVVQIVNPGLEARVADDLRDAECERVGLVLPLEVVVPENHAEVVQGALQSAPVVAPTKQISGSWKNFHSSICSSRALDGSSNLNLFIVDW